MIIIINNDSLCGKPYWSLHIFWIAAKQLFACPNFSSLFSWAIKSTCSNKLLRLSSKLIFFSKSNTVSELRLTYEWALTEALSLNWFLQSFIWGLASSGMVSMFYFKKIKIFK
jgi:hypothetical protein